MSGSISNQLISIQQSSLPNAASQNRVEDSQKELITELFEETQEKAELSRKAKKRLKAKAKAKAKKKELPQGTVIPEKKRELDPSLIFCKIDVDDSKAVTLFVPVNLLSQGFREEILNRSTIEHCESPDPKERLNKWKKQHKNVYEVESLTPPQIRNLPVAKFHKHFENIRELFASIKNLGCGPVLQSGPEFTEGKEGGLKIIPLSSLPKIIDERDLPANSKRIEDIPSYAGLIENLMAAFAKDLIAVVNRHGNDLIPTESIRLLWDSLSQLVLNKQGFAAEKSAHLSMILIKFWTDVNGRIMHGAQCGLLHEFDESHQQVESAIQQMENLSEAFADAIPSHRNPFISQLKEICKPLLKLLKSWNAIETNEAKEAFVQKLSAAWQGGLAQLGAHSVTLDPERKIVRQWLQNRADFLVAFLACEAKHLPPEFIIEGNKIQNSINNQNWAEAYPTIISFYDLFVPFISNDVRVIQSLIDHTPMQFAVLPPENFKIIRTIYIIASLRADLEFIIESGRLLHVVSEVAVDKIKSALSHFQSNEPEALAAGKQLVSWAKSLAERGESPDLLNSLIKLRKGWKELKNAKMAFTQPSVIQALATLIEDVESENYQTLAQNYLNLSDLLKTCIPQWVKGLRELNEAVIVVQKLSFALSTDQSLAKCSMDDLKNDFKILNQRSSQIVEPVNTFLNAFQQLISFEKNMQEIEGSSLNLDSESLSLALFSECEEEFANLRKMIEQQQENAELTIEFDDIQNMQEPAAEILEDTSTPDPDIINYSALEKEVKELFSNTKTRKIRSTLTQFLKERNIPIEQVFGKGDHVKFYLNGKLVTMPEHKEWKPGTAKSIQNTFLLHLQKTLSKNN